MKLSDMEKAQLLYKYGGDCQFGSRGKSMVEKTDSVFIGLADKGLVETSDKSNDYIGYSLTDDGKAQAKNIYDFSSADELERLGKLMVPKKNSHLPLPSGPIFMAKKIAQQTANKKKN